MRRLAFPTVLVAVVLLTACGGESGDLSDDVVDLEASPSESPSDTAGASPAPSATPPGSRAPTRPAAQGTRIVVADSEFGPMLFGADGQAIYLFDVEESTKPECYDDCAVAWPPVLTDGAPVAGDGVRAALLGTTERSDGETQVTYGGHPLYFYAHEGPGEVECHDVFLNGGNWYVVQPGGDRAP